MAQLKATSDSDYYAFFCDKIGNVYGIVHTAQKEKKVEQDDSFVQSSTQESVGVEDVRWGGFDCEKIRERPECRDESHRRPLWH